MHKRYFLFFLAFIILVSFVIISPSQLFAEYVITRDATTGAPTVHNVTYDNGNPVLTPLSGTSGNDYNDVRDFFNDNGHPGNHDFIVKSGATVTCPPPDPPDRSYISSFGGYCIQGGRWYLCDGERSGLEKLDRDISGKAALN